MTWYRYDILSDISAFGGLLYFIAFFLRHSHRPHRGVMADLRLIQALYTMSDEPEKRKTVS